MPLMVKCKSCRGEFSSKYQMNDTSSWHKPNYDLEISLICSGCGKTNEYSKEDHFFK